MNSSSIIKITKLCKLYGQNTQNATSLLDQGLNKEEVLHKSGVITALWNVDLEIYKGEVFSIIGLSGSGKSTLLRCLNMLNIPNRGHIYFEDIDVTCLSSKDLIQYRRNKMAMVFQHFALLTHYNVWENVAFGLEIKSVPKKLRKDKAMEIIKLVGLEGFENQNISSLSGGMRQRVGLARALANDAEVLLMDEPFSALDPIVRGELQQELLSIQQKLGKTIVLITHDINEACSLGDRVAVMRDGHIVQIASPIQLAHSPKDAYVKKFMDGASHFKMSA